MTDDSRKSQKERGLKIRREVLGDKYVDASLNNATEFSKPLQELLNEYCWGGPWASDGLSRKESGWLLDHLFSQVAVPEYQCRFRWTANSIAFWDNRSTQHYATADYLPAIREMDRVTIVGDRPFCEPV